MENGKWKMMKQKRNNMEEKWRQSEVDKKNVKKKNIIRD